MTAAPTRYGSRIADPELAARDEALIAALDRTYRRMVSGAIRSKGVSPERLAIVLSTIASDLLDHGEVFTAPPAVVDDDD